MATLALIKREYIRSHLDWQAEVLAQYATAKVLPHLGAVYLDAKSPPGFSSIVERLIGLRVLDAQMLATDCFSSKMGDKADRGHIKQCGAKAWHKAKRFGSGVTVAVLDTGVRPHDEFANRDLLSEFRRFDATGPVESELDDVSGHGTGSASLVGGAKSGVAPLAGLRHALMVEKSGAIATHTVGWALEWCLEQKCRIGLAAWGVADDDVKALIERAFDPPLVPGMLIVAAIGNEDGTTVKPGRFDFVLGVGALDKNDERWPCSGYDNSISKPDLCAPGQDVTKAWIEEPDRHYVTASGTSIAAAVAAGAAALVAAENPDATPTELLALMLTMTEENKDPGTGGRTLRLPPPPALT